MRSDSNSPDKRGSLRGSIEQEKELAINDKQKSAMVAKKSVRGSVNLIKPKETKMPKIHTFKDLSHLSYFGSKSKLHERTSKYDDDAGEEVKETNGEDSRVLSNEELS